MAGGLPTVAYACQEGRIPIVQDGSIASKIDDLLVPRRGGIEWRARHRAIRQSAIRP